MKQTFKWMNMIMLICNLILILIFSQIDSPTAQVFSILWIFVMLGLFFYGLTIITNWEKQND